MKRNSLIRVFDVRNFYRLMSADFIISAGSEASPEYLNIAEHELS